MNYQRFPLPLSTVFAMLLILPCLGFQQGDIKSKKGQHDSNAVLFIRNAAEQIYSPVREGLESFAFSRPMNTSEGEIGEERFVFVAPDSVTHGRKFNEGVPNVEEMERVMSLDPEANLVRAEQTMGVYLGTFLLHRLDEFDVRFLSSSAESVRIRCEARKDTVMAKQISFKDMIFTANGVIETIKTVNKVGKTQVVRFNLKPLEELGLLRVDQVEIENTSATGKARMIQTLIYEEMKGFQVVVKTHLLLTPMNTEVELESRDILINEPEPKPTEPEKKAEEAGSTED